MFVMVKQTVVNWGKVNYILSPAQYTKHKPLKQIIL